MTAGAGTAGVSPLRRLRLADIGILWITVALFVLLWQTSDAFLTTANLRNIVDQQSLIVLAGAAATLTLISGNSHI